MSYDTHTLPWTYMPDCKSHYVYAIAASAVDAVKIGISSDPADRLRSLQTGCPVPLKLRASQDCLDREAARWCEQHLHRRLKRYRLDGEWFKTGPLILRWLERYVLFHQDDTGWLCCTATSRRCYGMSCRSPEQRRQWRAANKAFAAGLLTREQLHEERLKIGPGVNLGEDFWLARGDRYGAARRVAQAGKAVA
jgi:hypothetical protein